MIKTGDKIPNVKVKRVGANGLEEYETDSLFKGKVVFFGVPGAFTPTCSNKHLPGYLAHADALKAKGVDRVVCLGVNDPFVMKAWSDATHSGGKVEMLADGNGTLTEAMDLVLDASGNGLGKRSRRFAMVVQDGVVKDINVEPAGGLTCSAVEDVLKLL